MALGALAAVRALGPQPLVRPVDGSRTGPDRRGPRLGGDVRPAGAETDPADAQRRERPQRRHRHPSGDGGPGRHRGRGRPGRALHPRSSTARPPPRALFWASRSAAAGASCCARRGGGAGVRRSSPVPRCWPWRCSPTWCPSRSARTALSPPSSAGSPSGPRAGRGGEKQVYYVEQTCGLASMVAWLLFGALAVPTLATSTLLAGHAVRGAQPDRHPHGAGRPVPAGLGAWRRHRGLRRVVRAARARLGGVRLIALEELHEVPGPVDTVVGTIGLTVLLSVLAHGLSARPLAGRYARSRRTSRNRAPRAERPATGVRPF